MTVKAGVEELGVEELQFHQRWNRYRYLYRSQVEVLEAPTPPNTCESDVEPCTGAIT